jgi:hypothetical protein
VVGDGDAGASPRAAVPELFYARKIFDDAEAGINAYFGVPMKH